MGSRTWRVERRIRFATAGLDVVKLVGGHVVVHDCLHEIEFKQDNSLLYEIEAFKTFGF